MKTLTVMCNPAMTRLVTPLRQSQVLRDPPDDDHVHEHLMAEFDEAALMAVTEEQADDVSAYWRHTPGLNIEVPYDETQLRRRGLFGYLDDLGITSQRHVAGAVMDLARNACKKPIEFFDWVVENANPPSHPTLVVSYSAGRSSKRHAFDIETRDLPPCGNGAAVVSREPFVLDDPGNCKRCERDVRARVAELASVGT